MGLTLAAYMDVDDWVDLGMEHISLILSWYNTAQQIQGEQGQLAALITRAKSIGAYVGTQIEKRAALARSVALLREQRQKQAVMVIKYFMEQRKQFRYYSLKEPAAVEFADDPTSWGIANEIVTLKTAIATEAAEQANLEAAWVHFTVNATQEPWTFKSLWSNQGKSGSNAEVTVNIPIPYNYSANNGQGVADTGYYNMRIADMRVLLLPGSSTNGKPVELYIKKAGKSFFLDESLQLYTFSHPPVDYGQLVYDKDYCPLSTNACSNSTNHTGGHHPVNPLCPNYIHYSPYGMWTVTVPDPKAQGFDISRVTELRFEFKVTYKPPQNAEICHIFGKNYEPAGPSQFGKLCATG